MTIESERLLTVREAARRCGRTPDTVRRWIRDGKLPAQKLRNQLFIQLADLDRIRGDDREAIKASRLAALEGFARIRERLR